MLPEFTHIAQLDKVQLARCFLALLQMALGLRGESETVVLAGGVVGPNQQRAPSTAQPWAQPVSWAQPRLLLVK